MRVHFISKLVLCCLFAGNVSVANDYPVGKEPKVDAYYTDYLTEQGIAITADGLSSGLFNKTDRIRKYSAIVAKQNRITQLVSSLEKAYQSEKVASVKLIMADALFSLDKKMPDDFLLGLIRKGDITSESVAAAGLLAQAGNADGYPIVKRGLTATEGTLRTSSLYQLSKFNQFEGRKGGGVVVSVYVDYASMVKRDDNPIFLKKEVFRELSDLKNNEAHKLLKLYSSDRNVEIATTAQLYLKKIEMLMNADTR